GEAAHRRVPRSDADADLRSRAVASRGGAADLHRPAGAADDARAQRADVAGDEHAEAIAHAAERRAYADAGPVARAALVVVVARVAAAAEARLVQPRAR